MQQRIRDFVTRYNATTGATILLTSHYMADVKALAERVVVIDHGKLLYDGLLTGLIDRYAPHKTITLHLERPVDRADVAAYGEVVSADDVQVSVRTDKAQAAAVTARMLAELPVADLSVEDPPLEYVIDQVFHRPGVVIRSRTLAGFSSLLRAELADLFQYRIEMFLYGLWQVVNPIIYLVIWSTVVGGGDIAGYTRDDFILYYLVFMAVSHLTLAIEVYTMAPSIQSGRLSPHLLRPLHPFWRAGRSTSPTRP